MSVHKFRRALGLVMGSLLLLAALAGGSVAAESAAYQTVSAPPEFKTLQGIVIQIPSGAKTPGEEKLWQAVETAQREKQENGPSLQSGPSSWPVWWYEEDSSWYDHWTWKRGGSASNKTSQTLEYTLSIRGSVGANFKGSLPAKLVVASEYSLSVSVEITHAIKVPVSPNRKATVWGTADGTSHRGRVHFDSMRCSYGSCRYITGRAESVRFFIPSSPAFDVTEVCRTCRPQQPDW